MKKFNVIIAAGGIGQRMGKSLPKQFFVLEGTPILLRTLDVFEKTTVSEIFVSLPVDKIALAKEMIEKRKYEKKIHLISGGKTRQESVYHALITMQCDYVLIHDAVRPFILPDQIEAIMKEVIDVQACAFATKAIDTMKETDQNYFVTRTIPRSSLYCVQSPQAFSYSLILQAHESAREKNKTLTDDCALVEEFAHPVKLLEGRYENFKITTKFDIEVAKFIIKQTKE